VRVQIRKVVTRTFRKIEIRAGDRLTGPINRDILRVKDQRGGEYRRPDQSLPNPGVCIDDKHIEVIIRQMLQGHDRRPATRTSGRHVDKVVLREELGGRAERGSRRHTSAPAGITKASLDAELRPAASWGSGISRRRPSPEARPVAG
jgi:hypothetical protein